MLVVLGIIGILAVLLVGGYSRWYARAQRIQCMANLRNLHLGAENYLQQNETWPQIFRSAEGGEEQFATAWINALQPFGVDRKTWICPTIQNFMHNPDYVLPQNARLDYMPMPFDDKPLTPHLWPQQPWFIEVGDVHGSGNLLIFTDGSITDLQSVLAQAAK